MNNFQRPHQSGASGLQNSGSYPDDSASSSRQTPASPPISWPAKVWGSFTNFANFLSGSDADPAPPVARQPKPEVNVRHQRDLRLPPINQSTETAGFPPYKKQVLANKERNDFFSEVHSMNSSRTSSRGEQNPVTTSELIRILASRNDWTGVKSLAEAQMIAETKHHAAATEPYMIPSTFPSPSPMRQLALPSSVTPRLNVSLPSPSPSHQQQLALHSAQRGYYSPRRRATTPYSSRFPPPSAESQYESRAFRPVLQSDHRIPDPLAEDHFERHQSILSRPRRSIRRSYPIVNKKRSSSSQLEDRDKLPVPSKRSAPTTESENKRIRRNRITPPDDNDDDMEEEQKKDEVFSIARTVNRKPVEMEVSPVTRFPPMDFAKSSMKEPPNDNKMKITPVQGEGLFGGSLKNDTAAPKKAEKGLFGLPKSDSSGLFANKTSEPFKFKKTEDEPMTSPKKTRKRKIENPVDPLIEDDPPAKRLALSQDTPASTQEATQKSMKDDSSAPAKPVAAPAAAPPKKESYMTKMLRKRWKRVEEEYIKRMKKIYEDNAPDKVSKVEGLVKKYTHARAHELYVKVCKKYNVEPKDEFTGEDSDVMAWEEEAPEKKPAPAAAPPFKFGDGSSNPLGGGSSKPVGGTKQEQPNFFNPFKPKTNDTGKDLKLPALFQQKATSDEQKKTPFSFAPQKNSDKAGGEEKKPLFSFGSQKNSDKPEKKGDLFGDKVPDKNDFSLKQGKRVNFKIGSNGSTPSSTAKPIPASGNPFELFSSKSSKPAQLNLGAFKSNDSGNNRMSIASNNGLQFGNSGSQNSTPFTFNSNNTNNQNQNSTPFTFNGSNKNSGNPFGKQNSAQKNPFSANTNNSPFANFNGAPTSSQSSFNPQTSGFSLGRMGTKKKKHGRY